MQVAVRILGPLEFTLGVLALGPRGAGEVVGLAGSYRGSPLVDPGRVEAALRMLAQAGAVEQGPGGKLHLRLDKLHPAYQAIAKAAAQAISRELNGASGNAGGDRGRG